MREYESSAGESGRVGVGVVVIRKLKRVVKWCAYKTFRHEILKFFSVNSLIKLLSLVHDLFFNYAGFN